MKISRLKFYAAVIPLVASVSFANTKAVTVHAEEEEVLYEVTDENVGEVIYEDIQPNEVPSESQPSTPSESQPETPSETPSETPIQTPSESQPETPSESVSESQEETKEATGTDPNEFIDADNYDPAKDPDPNAGNEIPDSVKTEAERKGITPETPEPETEPEKPQTPETPETPSKPSTPETPQTPETPEVPDTPQPIPDTGDEVSKYLVGGIALGTLGFGLKGFFGVIKNGVQNIFQLSANEDQRVVSSRRKFRKNKGKSKKLR